MLQLWNILCYSGYNINKRWNCKWKTIRCHFRSFSSIFTDWRRLLHQRIHMESLSREEGVKLINTNVIKFLRRIARSLEMQRYCLTSFNCNHKEAIVIKLLMNATQKLLMTLHFFATHWQPVLILINIPVKVFILIMIYSPITIVVFCHCSCRSVVPITDKINIRNHKCSHMCVFCS